MPSIAWLRNARSTSLADGYSTSCTAARIETAELAGEVQRLAADPHVGADPQRLSRFARAAAQSKGEGQRKRKG